MKQDENFREYVDATEGIEVAKRAIADCDREIKKLQHLRDVWILGLGRNQNIVHGRIVVGDVTK